MNRAYRESLGSSIQKVLVEEEDGVPSTGHAESYVRVWVEGTGLHNRVLPVKISGLHREGLLGESKECPTGFSPDVW